MSDKIDIEALKAYLPFYVNGSIEAADKAAIDEALAGSQELRSALEAERKLQGQFNELMEAELGADAREGDAQSAQRPHAALNAPDPAEGQSSLGQALSFLNPRNWSPAVTFALAAAAVGQTAAIAAQYGTIGDQREQIASLEAENFELASGQKECDEEASIILELRADAPWAEAAALIDGENLSIVSGTGQGVLMLGFEGDEADLNGVIERLKASQLVLNASKAA
ncbi:MAG: hypothetical protein AAF687_00970 [Pseudomonadota bacterium]